MARRALAALGMVLGLPAAAEPLDWLTGSWCYDAGGTRFEEHWTGEAGGVLVGMSRTLAGDRTAGFEFMRIEAREGRAVFLAQPGGKAETAFPRIEGEAQRIVFANTAHDFPQRIEYWRDASGLHALISGPTASGEKDFRFDYAPGACSGEGRAAAPRPAAGSRTMAEVLEASTAADWRRPDPGRTLYLELDTGRVVIELAPAFAPRHVDNILKLARGGYYDGLPILRVQDNFVVQWGDPDAGDEDKRRPVGDAERALPAEFTRPDTADLRFTRLPDRDGFALDVGFVDGFPAARGGGRAWLAHCYGTLGVGRDNDPNSGGGTELYVVIGHAPRQLDRNITVAGRVLQGMDLLASLPRGREAMGFHADREAHVPIRRVRVAADVPAAERSAIEVLRTDTPTFEALVESRRNRRDEWYKFPAGHIDLCNVPLPVRTLK